MASRGENPTAVGNDDVYDGWRRMAAKTKAEEGLEIPDHLGSNVTLHQKKRLAMMAKLGLGPVAKERSVDIPATGSSSASQRSDRDRGHDDLDKKNVLEKIKNHQQAKRPHKKKRRKARRHGESSSDDKQDRHSHDLSLHAKSSYHDRHAAEESDSGSDNVRAMHQATMARKASRDGGISWNLMSVASVRGKVSNDNRRMTDADLERRFGSNSSPDSSGLMSEDQVLAMLQREKRGSGDSQGSAARRARRELEEWKEMKRVRVQRNGKDHREHLVVSGRM